MGILIGTAAVALSIGVHLLGQRAAAAILGVPMRWFVLFARPFAPRWKRLLALLGGTVASYACASMTIFLVATCAGLQAPTDSLIVDQAWRDAPAEGSLEPGDRLVSVDGRPIHRHATGNTLSDVVQEKRGAPVRIVFVRNGVEREVEIVPREDPSSGSWRLGITMGYEIARRPTSIPDGILAAIQYPVTKTRWILAAAWNSALGSSEPETIGIVREIRVAAPLDAARWFEWFAFVNIVLALIHLAPIPPLDGGRALLIAFRREP